MNVRKPRVLPGRFSTSPQLVVVEGSCRLSLVGRWVVLDSETRAGFAVFQSVTARTRAYQLLTTRSDVIVWRAMISVYYSRSGLRRLALSLLYNPAGIDALRQRPMPQVLEGRRSVPGSGPV